MDTKTSGPGADEMLVVFWFCAVLFLVCGIVAACHGAFPAAAVMGVGTIASGFLSQVCAQK